MLPQRRHHTELAHHWTPLPEFDGDRALLACYATFDDDVADRDLHELVDAYQAPLRTVPGLAVVARAWLHSTVQGVAFLDQLPDGGADAVARLAAVLSPVLAGLAAPVVTVERPLVRGSGVDLPLGPVAELARVRDAVRDAAAGAHGPLYALPGQGAAEVFDPHITLAYANAEMPAARVRELVEAVPHRDLRLRLEAFTVLELRRADRTWTWTGGVRLPFGRRAEVPA
jgi:hypothetical protein